MPSITINGRAVSTQETFSVINPATGQELARAPASTAEHLDAAVAAAWAAFQGWRDTSLEKRRERLCACADRIRENRDALAHLIVEEQGKPLAVAQREVGGAAKWIEYTAGLPWPEEHFDIEGLGHAAVTRVPYGVVGAIAPWNYPVMSAVWKIAPALLAGNTIVVKPSPFTPLATLRVGELLLDVLPPGVLNILSGTDDLGALMTAHPGIRKITFTGSTDTGKKVFAAASTNIKGMTLEMGGNDPAIVLADADPGDTARKIYAGAFENAGQVCTAIKRVYVHESIHDAVVAGLAELARAAVVGDGFDEATTIGPVSNHAQFQRVLELLASAHAEGGHLVTGGVEPLDRAGYFIAPSIVTGLTDQSRLVAEEQFGPVLPVLSFDDVDDVVERANASPYGLSASVWGRDTASLQQVASRLDAGTVWINQHLKIVPQLPCAGVKNSGFGAENGPWGLAAFLQLKTIFAAG